MKWLFKVTIKLFFALLIIYGGLYGVFVLKSPLPYKWMDTNGDGIVLLGEAFRAIDVGTREVEISGKICTEYFWFKDGTPIEAECPNS